MHELILATGEPFFFFVRSCREKSDWDSGNKAKVAEVYKKLATDW